jgi:hypothetical protein
MKKIYFILFAVISFEGFVFSQAIPEFKLTKDGVKPVVANLDSAYNAYLIYTRVKEWIALNYKYPKSATRIDEENSVVKFSCYSKEAWKIRRDKVDHWYNMQYTLKVEMKDFKCRFTFETDEDRYQFWYNDDGTLMEEFKESEATFENTINEKLASVYNHIIGTEEEPEDDW